ncbi:PH domain-containing protein [Shewanella sp. WPAGA9]|uniref:PH domain-containing protein n=1 Tax=Shewanella sp. ENK2 TaxID=2775245 RepID=UPI00177ED33F|nr:PH domain-containing protein [Shewanella sp. WPAGA9]
MTEPSQQSTNQQSMDKFSQWQALSPWAMLSFSFGTAKAILSNGYAMIPIVFAGWKNGFDLSFAMIAALFLIISLTVFSFIQWKKYRFKLADNQLNIKRGLLFTRKDEIPFNKIQNIRYEQPLYFKPLKLGTLIIETAGSKNDEAHLAAVDSNTAYKIKQQLLQITANSLEENGNSESLLDHDDASSENDVTNLATRTHAFDNTEPANNSSQSLPNIIIKRNLLQLIKFGFYQNNLIWLAVIAGPILGQIQWETLAEIPFFQQLWHSIITLSGDNIILQVSIILLLIALVYCLFALISIFSAVLKYFPFTLEKRQQTLQRSGGVISHQQDALAIKRIQLVQISQPVLARLFNVWTVYLKQVKGQEVEQKTEQHMLIPSVKTTELQSTLGKITGLAGGSCNVPRQYQSIAFAWFLRRGYLPFIPAAILSLFLGANLASLLICVSAVVVSGLIYLRYRQWGYVIDEEAVWQHSGLFSREWKRIPFTKVQHVTLTQTQGQKQKGYAYLTLGLASGEMTLPYISQNDAQYISEKAMMATKYDTTNWI